MTTRDSLLKKFGSPEAVSEHYRQMKLISMQHPNNQKGTHKGGFSNIEFARQAGRLGGLKSKRIKRPRSQQ